MSRLGLAFNFILAALGNPSNAHRPPAGGRASHDEPAAGNADGPLHCLFGLAATQCGLAESKYNGSAVCLPHIGLSPTAQPDLTRDLVRSPLSVHPGPQPNAGVFWTY